MKIGLCLAGGGIKGAAHIGVLKALEEENIDFQYIAGTSSGSIVATLYAIGYSADEIYELFQKYAKKIRYVDFKNIIKLIGGLIIQRKIIIDGLTSGEIIEKIIEKACINKGITKIEQVPKKLLIPSVDLNTGNVYIFSSFEENRGYLDNIEYIRDISISKAVRASCSYPGVFSPCNYKQTQLVDGGIRENVPWKELKANGVDKVISVIFTKPLKIKNNKNIIDVVSNSLEIMEHELSNYELEGADILLKIDTKQVSLLETSQMQYLYQRGYKTAKDYLLKSLKT